MPVSAPRLSGPRPREGDRPRPGARGQREPGRSDRARRAQHPAAGAEEGAVGLRDSRLGPHPAAPRRHRDRRGAGHRDAAHPPEVPVRHREGGQGALRGVVTMPATSSMLDVLEGFIQELRTAGLPVSLTENLDAMEAVQHIPLEDREAFKYALAATLVKNNAHWRSFETVFEVYFSLRGPQYKIADEDDADEFWRQMQEQLEQGEGRQGGGVMDSLTPEELAMMLYQALLNGDDAMMRAMARQAVSRYAGMEPGRPVGGTYYLYRTLRNLDLDGMLEKLMDATREQVNGELTQLEERLERDEYG